MAYTIEKMLSEKKGTDNRIYAASGSYGYGFWHMRDDSILCVKECLIKHSLSHSYDRNEKHIVQPTFEPIKIEKTYQMSYGKHKEMHAQPLFLVWENNAWHEYFTGEVVVQKDVKTAGLVSSGINCELEPGSREFCFVDYSIEKPEMFYDRISRFSQSEIRSMINQFHRLQADAMKWSRNFDKIREEVRREEKQKRRLIANQLENGYGSYSSRKNQNVPSRKWIWIAVGLLVFILLLVKFL